MKMKKNLVFIMVLAGITAFIYGDVYIRKKEHTDSYYYSGITTPAQDYVNEMWIGPGKMASIQGNRVTIVDVKRSRVLLINKKEKNYVEIPLPLDLSKELPGQALSFRRQYRVHGTIKSTGKTWAIGQWKCKGYQFSSYISNRGDRQYDTDSTLWLAAGVPVDIEQYNRMNAVFYKLYGNFSDELIGRITKIKGFEVLAETCLYIKGVPVKSTSTVTHMEQQEPPPGIYSVPSGYTKKEGLSLDDL